jgi:hypothetical protein
VTVPDDPVVDLGSAMILGGDTVGSKISADRAAGCAGEPSILIPGAPDWTVNILDLTFVAGHFGAAYGPPEWQPSPEVVIRNGSGIERTSTRTC